MIFKFSFSQKEKLFRISLRSRLSRRHMALDGPRMNVLLADGHVEAKGSEINNSISPNNVPDLRMFYTTWEP